MQGIQLNVPPLGQCSVCQDEPYSYATLSADIERCKSMGNFIAVAARNSGESTLHMVAGLYSSELTQTSSTSTAAGPKNGAYWYYFPGKSFGFASLPAVDLNTADTTASASSGCEYRLSWHLENYYGGYRAGCTLNLNTDTTWRKIIYSCNVVAPTQVT